MKTHGSLLAWLAVFHSFLWAQVSLPYEESLDAAALPEGDGRIITSLQSGRARMLPGTTFTVGETEALISTSGGNRFRGNVYEVTSDTVLAAFDIDVQRAQQQMVDFSVYEASTLAGPYTRVFHRDVRVPAGTGLITSGDIGVPLKSGNHYLIGGYWQESSTYTYNNSGDDELLSFGTLVSGYIQNGPPGESIASVTSSISRYPQRLRVDGSDNSTVPDAGPLSSFTTGARFRANLYEVTEDTWLVQQNMVFNRSEETTIRFMVYESPSQSGTYTRIADETVTAPIGTGFVKSSRTGVLLQAGSFYIIGAHWVEAAEYEYKNSGYLSSQSTSFGEALQGVFVNGDAPGATLSTVGAVGNTAYHQELITLRKGALRFDSSSAGQQGTNLLEIELDLELIQQATVSFEHRASNQSPSTDGVRLFDSDNTSTLVVDLPDGTTDWQSASADLISAAASGGLDLTRPVWLVFQQSGSDVWPDSGREFRDITIHVPEDLALTDLDLPPERLAFKGFDSVKSIPIGHTFELRGGSTDSLGQTFDIDYRFHLNSGMVVETESLSRDFPAFSIEEETRSVNVEVPASTKISEISVVASVAVDSGEDLSEAVEINNSLGSPILINHYSGTLWFNQVETDITITDWTWRGGQNNTLHTISGNGTLDGRPFVFNDLDVVKNLTTLDYTVDPAENASFAFPDFESLTQANIRYRSTGGLTLNRDGLFATIEATLPAGLGHAADEEEMDLSATLSFPSASLYSDNSLESVPPLPVTLWICEETKPLMFEIDEVDWDVAAGTFTFSSTGDLAYVREPALTELEFFETNGDIPPEMAIRRSNELYYRSAAIAPGQSIVISTGTAGEALLTTDLGVLAGDYLTHHPYDTKPGWDQNGVLNIVNDLISSTSKLTDTLPLKVTYSQNCPTNCGEHKTGSLTLDATPIFSLTSTGGITTEGLLTAPGLLAWGTLPEEPGLPLTAQQAGAFSTGAYLASGHFMRGSNGESAFDLNTPGVLLNLGAGWGSPELTITPWTQDYFDGVGVYPGLNFRELDAPASEGLTVLGGVEWPPYPLASRSKYYIRYSGVSGIHQADAFNATGTIYGYPFTFTSLGFNYLSNTPQPNGSRTNGSLFLKYPTKDTIFFEQLSILCNGELDEAEPVEGGELLAFDFWNLDLTMVGLEFRRDSGCEVGKGVLVVTGSSEIDFIEPVMFADLAIDAGGEILPLGSDDAQGASSRFQVPASVRVSGPEDTFYTLVPAHNAYLNDYDNAGDDNQDPSEGYFSLAGHLDVPFFSDMEVQFHFGTGDGVLYLMGGWPNRGWRSDDDNHFFNSVDFDASHIARPPVGVDDLLDLDEYRSSTLVHYRPSALKEIFGLVSVDYPLAWDTSTRSFESAVPRNDRWLATTLDHQVIYMDAENVEISFGLQYDGLPRLNLTNFVLNEIDDQLNIGEAFSEGVLTDIRTQLEAGIDSLDSLLKPASGNILEPLIGDLIEDPLRDLYQELRNQYAAVDEEISFYDWTFLTPLEDGPDLQQFEDDLAQYLTDSLLDGNGPIDGLADRIDSELASAIGALDSLIPDLDPSTGEILLGQGDGLLARTQGGEFETLGELAYGLIQVFGPVIGMEADAIARSAIDPVLEELERPLTAIANELDGVRKELTTLKDALNGELRSELESLVPAVPAELDTLADEIVADAVAYLRTLPPDRNPLDDLSPDDFVAEVRQRAVLQFLSSDFHREMATILRARVYQVEGRMRQGIDSMFAQVNKGIRELLSGVLNSIDEEVNEFAGVLGDYIGAGQIDGYAHIRGESLERVRLDGAFQWKVPDELSFQGFMDIEKIPTTGGSGACSPGSVSARKISVGATELPSGWMGNDLRVNVSTSMTFGEPGPGIDFPVPIGLGGQFWLSESSDPIEFEDFEIPELGAGVAFGVTEAYISANARALFNSAEVAAGIFFGATCNIEPLLIVDPQVGDLLGTPPLIGGYVYGEGWVPVVDYGCALNVAAGIGAGIFFFSDTDNPPTFGMKILLGGKGEAICVVSVRGEVRMVGMRRAGRFVAQGRGKLSGKAGACPFCVRFSKTVTVTYDDGDLDISY